MVYRGSRESRKSTLLGLERLVVKVASTLLPLPIVEKGVVGQVIVRCMIKMGRVSRSISRVEVVGRVGDIAVGVGRDITHRISSKDSSSIRSNMGEMDIVGEGVMVVAVVAKGVIAGCIDNYR